MAKGNEKVVLQRRAIADIHRARAPRKVNYKTRAQELAQLCARLRDTDENGYGHCISCGKEASRDKGNWQGGHYFDKGMHPALAAEPDNIHLQCRHCNYYGMNDPAIQLAYTEKIASRLGPERMKILKAKAASKDNPDVRAALVSRGQLPLKYTQQYWRERCEELKEQCRELAARKNWKIKI